jgi:hypothetical protein
MADSRISAKPGISVRVLQADNEGVKIRDEEA